MGLCFYPDMAERFSRNPKENHMMEIKRILRYMKGIEDYGLWYKKGGSLDLNVFIDVDWEGSVDDRKSTTGGVLFHGKRLVSLDKQEEKLYFLVYNRGIICGNNS